jgi:hypothetical protein
MVEEHANAFPKRMRCGVVLTSRRGLEPGVWVDALKDCAAGLREVFPAAHVAALNSLNTGDGAEAVGRELGRQIDGSLAVTLDAHADVQEFLKAIPVLRHLTAVVDVAGCTVNLGEAHCAKSGTGTYGMALLAFRDRRVSQAEFVDWWLNHHSPIALASPMADIMDGYTLQHRTDPATSEMNRQLGFADTGDIFELVFINDLQRWERTISPEIAATFYNDEEGFLAREGNRMAMQQMVF